MFICLDCGEVFETPSAVIEDMGECHGERAYREYKVSPCCGGDYDYASACEKCGNYTTPSQYDRFGLCSFCEEEILERCQLILAQNFTEREINFLNSKFDIDR